MKQIISLLLALIMLLCTAGCNTAPIPPEPDPEPTPEPAPTTQEVQETQKLQEVPEPKSEPFVFTRENFPILDGSTSTVPLAKAMAAILLSEPQAQVEDLIEFSRTTTSYRALIYQNDYYGKPDLLLAAEPAELVWEEKAKNGVKWNMTPFAIDGLIFVVNEDNPVDSLTVEQVQKIYTGEITNWSEVGGNDVEIIPFQRNEEAGSQTMMKMLVMGELPMMEPPVEYQVDSMGALMDVVRGYEDSTGAIGYSVYYYANDMRMAEGLKILQIDGVDPGADSFRDKSYPFTNPYYVVMLTNHAKDDPTTILFNWILSEEGQRLVDQLGYVAVHSSPEESAEAKAAPQVYADWSLLENTSAAIGSYSLYWPEPKTELIPHDGYGLLTPFYGKVSTMYSDEFPLFGLATLDGKAVVEPVYSDVSSLYWNNEALPVFALQQIIPDEERIAAGKQNGEWLRYDVLDYIYGLAAIDGSWYIPPEYAYATAISPDRILLVDIEGKFWLCDLDGNIVESPVKETGEGLYGSTWRDSFKNNYYSFIDDLFVITLDDPEETQSLWIDFQTGEQFLKPGSVYDSRRFDEALSISSTGLEIHMIDNDSYYMGVYDPTNDNWVLRSQNWLDFFTDAATNEAYVVLDLTNTVSGIIEKRIIYNSAGEQLFETDQILPPVNGVFPVYDGFQSGLIDKEGNWVMRFPIRSNSD